MGLIASHRQRAHNMQVARRQFGPVGLFIIVCGIVVIAAGLADAGADAVITGVVFVVVGAAMAASSRRRWRLEDSRYRPSRLFR